MFGLVKVVVFWGYHCYRVEMYGVIDDYAQDM